MFGSDRQQSPVPPSGGKTTKQRRLSALFLSTTLIAVAASDYSRGQTRGLWFALVSCWFIALGLVCMLDGIASRAQNRFLLLAVSVFVLGLGIPAFVTKTGTYLGAAPSSPVIPNRLRQSGSNELRRNLGRQTAVK